MSLTLWRGETLGIVGESGSRKSTVARCVARLVVPTSGAVRIDNTDIASMKEAKFRHMRRRVANRCKSDGVFLNRINQPLTRFGIHRLVTQYVKRASKTVPSLATKRVSPHTIRHTTAVHLLRAGVDINTIRAWLGHVSLDTTHVYAEVDMEMKAKALARVDISDLQITPQQRTLPSLMAFLKAL